MLNLQGIEMGALFSFFFISFHHLLCVSADFADLWNSLSLCLLLCFPTISQIYGFELGNNSSGDHSLNTPVLLLPESKAVGQIQGNSCQSLVISNSSQGELESKHQIGKEMRSVNSGMATHQSAGSKRR